MQKTGPPKPRAIDPHGARKKLESAATLHWFHWFIVSLSLLLTFFAWYYSKSELEARIEVQFDREVDRVVELIQERMGKYEDALWGGVALIDASGGEVDFEHWQAYAQNLHIESKYPGINGIGVIHAMSKHDVPDFLIEQRQHRPDFYIHPPHDQRDSYPISYITPVRGNEKAVGLDIAHESNRFSAAQKARDTGKSCITGPITLVQDSSKTPGFLFYAPFYNRGTYTSTNDRQQHFHGMVYAPFVVKKLMEGTLTKEKRQVGVRIVDGNEVLFDEHVISEADFDVDPLFKRSIDVDLYGRTWTFDVWGANSFREESADHQPLVILLGGIFIDSMLVLLFISISRASHNALGYADSMTYELEANTKELQTNQLHLAKRARQLKESNAELEQFAYVASHDLQEPLRKVSSFCQLLKDDYGDLLDKKANTYIDYAVDGAKRMKTLVSDLLDFSRVSSDGKSLKPTNSASALKAAILNLQHGIEEASAVVTSDDLPMVMADHSQFVQLLQNLIGNGIRYCDPSLPPQIHLSATPRDDDWVFSVRDNGIGIREEYFSKVFEIFKRLHARDEYAGTGIGLAICKRIVDRWGGKIWVASEEGVGSTFYFTAAKLESSIAEAHSADVEQEVLAGT